MNNQNKTDEELKEELHKLKLDKHSALIRLHEIELEIFYLTFEMKQREDYEPE